MTRWKYVPGTDICPNCNKPMYISKHDKACSDPNCEFSIGINAYIEQAQENLMSYLPLAKQILKEEKEHGRGNRYQFIPK